MGTSIEVSRREHGPFLDFSDVQLQGKLATVQVQRNAMRSDDLIEVTAREF